MSPSPPESVRNGSERFLLDDELVDLLGSTTDLRKEGTGVDTAWSTTSAPLSVAEAPLLHAPHAVLYAATCRSRTMPSAMVRELKHLHATNFPDRTASSSLKVSACCRDADPFCCFINLLCVICMT